MRPDGVRDASAARAAGAGTREQESQVLRVKPRAEPTFAARWNAARTATALVSSPAWWELQQNHFHLCLPGWTHQQRSRDALCGISRCFILQKFLQTFDSLAVWEGSWSLSFAWRFEQERAQHLKQRPMSLTCVHVSP